MKTSCLFHLFLVCGVCAAAASAQAQTIVRLTGSTAFRSATHTAIRNIMPDEVFGFTGSTIGSASQAIFTGTVNGASVIIKTSWSGAVGGQQSVVLQKDVNFLPNTTAQSAGGTSGATTGTEAAKADVAMLDHFPASTEFNAPGLVNTIVGVIGFKWVASKGSPAGLANMTPQLAQALWANGELPLSLFTGSNADATTKVFATGRDPDSGTRLTAFAESGIGIASPVVQWQPTFNATDVTSHQIWPASTVNGIPVDIGNGGYSSGGTLATAMQRTTAAIGGYYVTYMSTSDAATAEAGGAKALTYNGVPYSLPAVQEGQYTFWCYEQLMYLPSLTGTAKAVADTLAAQIRDVDAPVRLSTMKCQRSTDGGVITPNF